MNIHLLRQKTRDNLLEVEDLLACAKTNNPALADGIEKLHAEYHWPISNHESGHLVVPLGAWANMVVIYLREGYPGLKKLLTGRRPGYADLVLGLLADGLPTVPSVQFILDNLGRFDPLKTANTFNLILSFKKRPAISEKQRIGIRDFLHRLLKKTWKNDLERSIIYCALRSVEDE